MGCPSITAARTTCRPRGTWKAQATCVSSSSNNSGGSNVLGAAVKDSGPVESQPRPAHSARAARP